MEITIKYLKIMKKVLFLLLISLQVSAQTVRELPAGNYGVVKLFQAGVLKIKEDVTVERFENFNTSTTVIVESSGKLTINNLHLNGRFEFINKGEVKVLGSVEEQGGLNLLYNYGKFLTSEFQINDNTSVLELDGCSSTFTVQGSLNLNTSKTNALTLKNGAQILTNGLNIGGANTITGKGLIKVTGSFNLNHNLTTSSEINLCYKGHLNQPEKLGAANLSCDAVLCSPLPVKVSQVLFKKKDDMIEWEFNLIDADGTDSFDVMLSDDAKTWSTVLHVEIDKVNPNKKYSGTIKLKLK